MDLPFFKKETTLPPRQYLFAIEISPAIVKSAIWSVINNKTQVLSVGCAATWDDQTTESLIAAVDQTITDAVSHLDPSGKIQPEQVIFGLSPNWVGQDKIHPDKLQLLKDLSSQLELKPVGFVITPEAVVKFLAHTENVPSTAILLGFWPHQLEVTLVRMGKIDGIQTVQKSSHLADDVVEGLSRFPHVDILPSRMLLYDSGLDLEEIKQLLLEHPWQAPQKRLPFLHFPKIEILPADFTVRAIALSGGTEVARAIGLVGSDSTDHTDHADSADTADAADLGFVTDADVRDLHPTPPPPASPTAPLSSSPSPKLAFKLPSLPKFSFPRFSLPNIRLTGHLLAISLPTVLIGLFVAYWFVPKGTVTLLVTPKNFATQFDLTADTKSTTLDSAARTLPAESLEVSVTGDKSLSTTGSKLVGDKSTGSVSISNTLDSSRSLPAGTVLTSPSGLKFILDEDITIASASGSADNLIPGKATAKATSDSIGSQHNLAGGTIFRVSNFAITQISAKNDSAFSGGSSRQVKSVSKDDISSLRSQLTDSLKDQARQKLLEQIGEDKTVIAESISLLSVTEEFDRKLDETADNLSLKLTVKAQGLSLTKSDLQSLVEAHIQPQIPAGFSSISEGSQNFSVKKVNKDSVVFTMSVSALLLPEMDRDGIIRNITGKFPSQAKSYLETLPGVSRIDILISPALPSFIATLPRLSKNITLSVQPLQ